MAHVLVVDDSPQIRALLRIALRHAGHQVTAAADGREAIEAYRARPADLVFCDLYMPGVSGFEAIRELRRKYPAVRIVAVSGAGLAASANARLVPEVLGVAALLPKPFSVADAVALAAQVLRTPRAE